MNRLALIKCASILFFKHKKNIANLNFINIDAFNNERILKDRLIM